MGAGDGEGVGAGDGDGEGPTQDESQSGVVQGPLGSCTQSEPGEKHK